jgi:uncharacterized protein YfkK (UPF0435 family)
MDYQKAKDIRGKRFSELMTDKLVAGEGIGSSLVKTLSERSKARSVGLKQKFDPLNIAKILTGGSRLGPAILGKMTGASQERMSFFAGDPKKKKLEALNSSVANPEFVKMASESLGNIYDLLKKDMENKKLQREQMQSKEEEQESEEEKRNQELIKALTARVKPKAKKKKEEQQIIRESETKTPTPPVTKKGKAPTAPAATKPTAPTKAPAPAAPAPIKAPAPTKAPAPAAPKPTAAPAPKAPTGKPPTTTKIPPVVAGGSKGLVLSALIAAGYSKSAQANMMANVEKESNFNPRNEEIPRAEKIFSMFGPPGVKGGQPENGKNKVRFQTLQEAQDIVAAGPEAYFNKVYDGRMGNTSPGDGYKYRGRGFIQITGKDMYNRVGKMIGEDLVGNPDLANKPEIAAKIVPAFFQLKLKERKLNIEDYDKIDVVNTVVGGADMKSREQRKTLAATYANELNTGNQIDVASKENKDLKSSLNKDRPKQTVVNNTNISSETENANQGPEVVVDDRPAPLKKKG